MRFKIKNWGSGKGIYINNEFSNLYKVEEGDMINIPEDVFKELIANKEFEMLNGHDDIKGEINGSFEENENDTTN